jgi:hypothetical protein
VFTPEQHREKAAEYAELARQANVPDDGREERSLTMLAENEQWLADNHNKLVNNLEDGAAVPTQQEHASNVSKETSEANRPEGFQIIEYNEQEEIVTIELHRHLLQHPGQREAIMKNFIEIIEHGPKVKRVNILSALE